MNRFDRQLFELGTFGSVCRRQRKLHRFVLHDFSLTNIPETRPSQAVLVLAVK